MSKVDNGASQLISHWSDVRKSRNRLRLFMVLLLPIVLFIYTVSLWIAVPISLIWLLYAWYSFFGMKAI